jgi:RNase P protein component
MVRGWSLKPGELVPASFSNFNHNATSVEEKEKKRLQRAIFAEVLMLNKLSMNLMFILKKDHQTATKKDLEMQQTNMLTRKLEMLFLNFNNCSMTGLKESEMI